MPRSWKEDSVIEEWKDGNVLWGSVVKKGFPGGSASKESICNAGNMGSIPGLGRSPGEGNG